MGIGPPHAARRRPGPPRAARRDAHLCIDRRSGASAQETPLFPRAVSTARRWR
jgi:hypothetical protein